MSYVSASRRDAAVMELLCALGARTLCPRLPRLGERVVVRDSGEIGRPREASAWTEELVVAELHVQGGQAGAQTESGLELRRVLWRALWVFPGEIPADG